ncbi:MAG: gliding motility-associated C-terminal domain-containing protein, partial [Saprospiraceae bacterium]|nr:gliding motility-associated C-terminal domain-containing protein [Saprospiraceae bacterium]
VAADISVPLTGIIPNAVGGGILRIRHLGDNAQLGEYFNVYDEAGNFLDTTSRGTLVGECNGFFETIIPVTDVQINNWGILGGAFGSTFFYLESNRDLVNYADFIGNCAPLQPGGTDGISQVQVTLEYSYAIVNYAVKNVANQTVASGTLLDNSTTVTLPPANYTVMYNTSDEAGLGGMATFSLTVRDTIKPLAICQPTGIVYVDPSGAAPYTVQPSILNNGSSDNCTPTGNLVFNVSPGTITCNQAGGSVSVTLTVTDSSGNSSNCQTVLGVFTTPPQPSFTPVCEGGELQLFTNPPSNAPYSYQWAGVNNYSSNQQNPIVTSNAMAIHNGTYCVTITGATGCTSSACVPVELAILSTTPVLNSNGLSFCPGQSISLTTDPYPGGGLVNYQWLVDSVNALPGGPVVLGNTTTPVFPVGSPPPGQYVYYVKVFANGCNTALSNALTVTVNPTPPAAVSPSSMLKCECETITLNSTTPSFGGSLTYMWMGPGGFTSNAATPLVTTCAVEAQHEGLYTLITKRFGCSSNPVTVQVNINPKPPKPSLTGVVNVCEGQTITLTCNVLSGDQWIWTSPTFDTYITDPFNGGNVLQIPNANATHEGNWSVIVRANNCFSDESQPIRVEVQQYPVITAASNGPICKDSLLLLSASFSSTDTLTWVWTYPNGMQQFLQNPTVPNGASGVYTVIARTSFGCADTATVNVTNVTPPVIDFIGNNAPACCDNTSDATLSATISSLNPPLSYKWVGPPAFGTSTLPAPVIADICTTFNGQYTLVVKDSFGCPSLPATTEINIQEPPVMPMLQVLDNTLCAGDSIFLFFNNPTNGATYTWNLPGGTTTQTTVPYLTLHNAQPNQSGLYTVFATAINGLCVSGVSNAVSVTVHPIPSAPTISSNSPVCEGGVLQLSAPSIPGAQYFWTGPFGFVSSEEDPIRMMVTTGMQGEYRLRVVVNGCSSAQSFLFVDVEPIPATPFIADAPDRICIDAPVTAFLNILNPVDGMEYTWVDASSGIPLLGPSTTTSLNLSLPQVLNLGPGTQTFRVQAQTAAPPGCLSSFSNTITVEFDTIPEGINAFAGMDRFACVNNEIVLSGSPNPLPGIVSGFWTQIGTPLVTIDDATSPNASFIGQANNIYTFEWSLSNGECKNFSRDSVQITAQFPEVPNGGLDIVSCSTVGIQLNATQGTTAQGIWVQLAQQAQLGVVIDDPTNPNTTISGNLNFGQNFAFYWQIGNDGCGISSDEVIVYIYSNKPNAGPPQFVCNNQNCTELSASVLAGFESGAWSSNNLNITFTNPSSPNTTVCGLAPGTNEIYWTTNGGFCGDQSRDTVVIEYEIFPTAVNDFVSVEFGDTAHVNVLLNDILPNFYTVRVTVPPATGRIDTLATGVYVYRPQSGFTGTETMTYQICNTKCPDACNSATVTFQTGGAPECTIPTIITPNGDGFNDAFTIPSVCTVGEGGTVEVTIFNQWGDLVFHADPYLNDWEGTFNSEPLPAGTYFYVVKISVEELPKKGFLLIQR